jgi:hypothetical protein
MAPKFETHLEDWNHALHIDGLGHKSEITTLLYLLKKYNVHPMIYYLGDWKSENPIQHEMLKDYGYALQYHGVHHYYNEKADRSPYFNQEGFPGMCGGFFFRLLPLWIVKREIKRTGLFYIHPHDLDETHPRLKNPFLNWKRHIGLKTARKKIERLLKEVQFA